MFLKSIDDYVSFAVTTHTPSTGADVDADSVPTYRIYEDVTDTPILTGSMAKLDDSGTLGFYGKQVQCTAANGFEVAKCYNIRVSGTVGGVSGSAVVGTIEIINPATLAQQADAFMARTLGSESYAADGAIPTLGQAMFMLLSKNFEMSISGTTMTCKKLDGTTTAMSFTLNNAFTPTGITRFS